MIFRLTQKLAKKIGVAPIRCLPLHKNPFADWTGHLFTADRVQYIFLTNTASLYSIIVRGRGISDPKWFLTQGLSRMRQYMREQGDGDLFHRFIEQETQEVSFSKTGDRRVTGSMNDLIHMAKFHLVEGKDTLSDTCVAVNKSPMSSISYANPAEAFRSLNMEELEDAAATIDMDGNTGRKDPPDVPEQEISKSKLPHARGMTSDNRYTWTRSADEFNWSKSEKRIAREAFGRAQEREFAGFAGQIRSEAEKISGPGDIRAFYGFMSERLTDIDEKYDYRYSVLIRVFAMLIRDGWLDIGELAGFADDKIERIQSLISAWNEMNKHDRN